MKRFLLPLALVAAGFLASTAEAQRVVVRGGGFRRANVQVNVNGFVPRNVVVSNGFVVRRNNVFINSFDPVFVGPSTIYPNGCGSVSGYGFSPSGFVTIRSGGCW
jgi:hypothetical protein